MKAKNKKMNWEWARLYWRQRTYPLEEIDNIDDNLIGFYAILGAMRTYKEWRDLDLLYIGEAFRKPVKDRIKEPHKAYKHIKKYIKDNPKKVIIIMVGEFDVCSLDRITEQFYKDVECCLIYSNRPLFNESCINSYTGRPILILNEGDYSPLRRFTFCS